MGGGGYARKEEGSVHCHRRVACTAFVWPVRSYCSAGMKPGVVTLICPATFIVHLSLLRTYGLA